MRLGDLKTPAALVDVARLAGNAAWGAKRARDLGVALRPHVKTHKCVEAARIQTLETGGAITVSTFAEARAFAAEGFRDILHAVPLSPGRLDEAAELAQTVPAFHVLLDHPATAERLEAAAARRGLEMSVFLKVDCGYHRAGVDPRNPEALIFARSLAESVHLKFRGVLTHAGHAYGARNADEAARVAEQERTVTAAFAEALRAEGVSVETVSVGSTPTFAAARSMEGVTEARPGNYLFFDAHQAAIGSCAEDDIAFGVLATVVGCYPNRNEAVVDAGALALSKDAGPVHVDPACGFGLLAGESGERLAGLRLVSLTQEHGLIRARPGATVEDLRPGSRLRIFPNHSCLAAACFDRYHVLDGQEVIDLWHPVRGW